MKYNGINVGEGYTEFERYDAVKAAIEKHAGTLSEEQVTALLAQVGIKDEDTDKLQWSVLYNLTTGDGALFAHRNTEDIVRFHIEVNKD